MLKIGTMTLKKTLLSPFGKCKLRREDKGTNEWQKRTYLCFYIFWGIQLEKNRGSGKYLIGTKLISAKSIQPATGPGSRQFE